MFLGYKQVTPKGVCETSLTFHVSRIMPTFFSKLTASKYNVFGLPVPCIVALLPFMANTYSQIYIQIVFAVEGRQNLIPKEHKEELHKYISGIVRERDQKPLAVHCMPDHTHLLVGLKPSMALSELVRDVKNGSSGFVTKNGWVHGRFSWQEGFGAFSYGHSQLTGIINYIRNQEEHHARKTFRQEYLQFLKKYEIEHDERFIFRFLE